VQKVPAAIVSLMSDVRTEDDRSARSREQDSPRSGASVVASTEWKTPGDTDAAKAGDTTFTSSRQTAGEVQQTRTTSDLAQSSRFEDSLNPRRNKAVRKLPKGSILTRDGRKLARETGGTAQTSRRTGTQSAAPQAEPSHGSRLGSSRPAHRHSVPPLLAPSSQRQSCRTPAGSERSASLVVPSPPQHNTEPEGQLNSAGGPSDMHFQPHGVPAPPVAGSAATNPLAGVWQTYHTDHTHLWGELQHWSSAGLNTDFDMPGLSWHTDPSPSYPFPVIDVAPSAYATPLAPLIADSLSKGPIFSAARGELLSYRSRHSASDQETQRLKAVREVNDKISFPPGTPSVFEERMEANPQDGPGP